MKKAYSVLGIATFFLMGVSAVAQNYTVTDLGLLPGETLSKGWGVGESGQVVGFSGSTSTIAAFRWTKRAGIRPLRLPSGYSSSLALAINGLGDIAGQANISNGNVHALLWMHNGRILDLGVPKGSANSSAYGVNDRDEVVGFGDTTAFVWTRGGGFTDLGLLPGGTFTVGWRINFYGDAVGFGDTPSGNDHGFLWTKQNGMRDLGLLPGGTYSEALGNNNFGQVVGSGDCIYTSCAGFHAILWSENGEDMRDLGTLSGDSGSAAYAVNDFGQVVGESHYIAIRAFVWTAGTGMVDLNSRIPANSGWALNVATSINVKGQISGYGIINGQTHAFLLTPTGN